MAPKAKYATAVEMAAAQREISVAEFFAKNRHLLGFDNPAKAVRTPVREAVDNSLDACEEAGILPDITVEISHVRVRKPAADGPVVPAAGSAGGATPSPAASAKAAPDATGAAAGKKQKGF